jgi:hypothetical protein
MALEARNPIGGVVAATTQESAQSAISWGAIIGGAVAAMAITLILIALGSGLGLSAASPWTGEGSTATTLGVATVIWLIVVQWFSSGVGGYMAGRLRTRWSSIHADESFFRDTAHGFLAWALATLVTVGLLASAASSAIGTGVQAAANVGAGAAQGATSAMSELTERSGPRLSGTACGGPCRDLSGRCAWPRGCNGDAGPRGRREGEDGSG